MSLRAYPDWHVPSDKQYIVLLLETMDRVRTQQASVPLRDTRMCERGEGHGGKGTLTRW